MIWKIWHYMRLTQDSCNWNRPPTHTKSRKHTPRRTVWLYDLQPCLKFILSASNQSVGYLSKSNHHSTTRKMVCTCQMLRCMPRSACWNAAHKVGPSLTTRLRHRWKRWVLMRDTKDNYSSVFCASCPPSVARLARFTGIGSVLKSLKAQILIAILYKQFSNVSLGGRTKTNNSLII